MKNAAIDNRGTLLHSINSFFKSQGIARISSNLYYPICAELLDNKFHHFPFKLMSLFHDESSKIVAITTTIIAITMMINMMVT